MCSLRSTCEYGCAKGDGINYPCYIPLYTSLLRHYSDVIISAMASQITGVSIVYSTIIQAQIKENIKAPRHWPLWGEFTVDRWNPTKRASNVKNVSIWWRHHGFIVCFDFHMSKLSQGDYHLHLRHSSSIWCWLALVQNANAAFYSRHSLIMAGLGSISQGMYELKIEILRQTWIDGIIIPMLKSRLRMSRQLSCRHIGASYLKYCQISNIRHTSTGNAFVDHSDVFGASPVGAAPTTSSSSITPGFNGLGKRRLQDKTRNISVRGFGAPYIRDLTVSAIYICRIYGLEAPRVKWVLVTHRNYLAAESTL